MARKVLVEVIADVSSFQKGLATSASEAKKFEASITGTATRVRSSILGMGTAFLGAAGFIAVVSQSVKAAEAYNTALRATDVAIKSTGGSVAAYSGQVKDLADAGQKLGYSNADVLTGFKLLTLVTGNATDATKYMGLAEDLARARGVSLEAATTAVGKAIDGKTSSLQRYGVVATKGESVEKLLTDAYAKYGGQALANTTTTEKLRATLTNLEASIGNVLLPTIEKIAGAIENWIGKSQNQKKVLDDLRKAVADATSVIETMYAAVSKVAQAFGGWRNLILLLIGIKIASWAAGVVSSLYSIGAAATAAAGPVSILIGLLVAATAAAVYLNSKSTEAPGNQGNYRIGPGGVPQKNEPTGPRGSLQKWVTVSGSEYTAATGHAIGAGSVNRSAGFATLPTPHPAAVGAGILPASYGGGGGAGGGGGGGGSKGKKAPTYKISTELEAKIRLAQEAFKNDVTKSHLDILTGLLNTEEGLLKAHGQDAQASSVANEITSAHVAFQKKLAQMASEAATANIAKIEAESTGADTMLKLATAANQPTDVILADQQNLLQSYQTESNQLSAKLASATGAAKAKYQAAIAKIGTAISSTRDSIATSLETLATAAQTTLQNVLGMVKTAAEQNLGAQYYQGGQTPSEALLSAMQAEDTKTQLQDALTTALTAGDPAAIAAAQRAITENDLAIQATKERSDADAAYAKAVFNLDTQIDGYTKQFTDGKITLAQFQADMTALGVPLGQLADPGGNGLFSQLASASNALVAAFGNLIRFLNNGLNVPGSPGNPSTGLAGQYFLLNPPQGTVTVPVTVAIDGNAVGQAVQTFAVQDLIRGGSGIPGKAFAV